MVGEPAGTSVPHTLNAATAPIGGDASWGDMCHSRAFARGDVLPEVAAELRQRNRQSRPTAAMSRGSFPSRDRPVTAAAGTPRQRVGVRLLLACYAMTAKIKARGPANGR